MLCAGVWVRGVAADTGRFPPPASSGHLEYEFAHGVCFVIRVRAFGRSDKNEEQLRIRAASRLLPSASPGHFEYEFAHGIGFVIRVRAFGRSDKIGVRLRIRAASRLLLPALPGCAGQCSPASLRVAKGCGNFGVGTVKAMDADEEQYDQRGGDGDMRPPNGDGKHDRFFAIGAQCQSAARDV